MERNLLDNGRFIQNINSWDSSNATYSAGDGDAHYGVAVLQTGGGYIEQDFAVPDVKGYSLHTAVKGIGAAITSGQVTVTITDGDGNTVTTINLTGDSDEWSEETNTLGLAHGTTYSIKIANVSAAGNVYVDDVWLWFVPITRANLAARTHAKLGRLATDRSLSTSLSGALTEGDYTYAIDAALRAFDAINDETEEPDIRYLDASMVQNALDMVRAEMLEKLQVDYAVEVDTVVGPYNQRLSQKSDTIGKIISGGNGSGSSGGSSGAVIQRKLKHD